MEMETWSRNWMPYFPCNCEATAFVVSSTSLKVKRCSSWMRKTRSGNVVQLLMRREPAPEHRHHGHLLDDHSRSGGAQHDVLQTTHPLVLELMMAIRRFNIPTCTANIRTKTTFEKAE